MFMVHGPCGVYNPHAPCMVVKGPGHTPTCSKGFPKRFNSETVVHEDGYPEYRRRDDGRRFTVPAPGRNGQQVELDNRWIMPYNPYLLRKY